MKKILENIIIIFSMTFIVFLILDYYNAKMDFVGNALSRKILLCFCVISIINSFKHLLRKKIVE